MKREDLKRIAIHCKTKKDAIQCFRLAYNLGWIPNRYQHQYHLYKEKTCYDFYINVIDNIDNMKKYNYQIQTAEWFLENFTELLFWEKRKWELVKSLVTQRFNIPNNDSNRTQIRSILNYADIVIEEYKENK